MNNKPGCAKRGTIIHPVHTQLQLPLCINQLTAVNEFLRDTKQPLRRFPVPAFSLKTASDWTKPRAELPYGGCYWLLGASLSAAIASQ